MATDYAAPAVPARPGRREEARQDRLVRAQIDRERDTAYHQARTAEREAAARMALEAAGARAARRAVARAGRAARWARLAAWAGEHVVDLLFVPVIGVPAVLAWTAMSQFGARLYGPPGYLLPAFSEGAMWAFAAAVTITLRRDPAAQVWHLRAGTAVFAAVGAALNFLHGLTMATPLFPSLPSGPLTGAVMAIVSVAGVIAHQLITAGPGRKRRPAVPVTAALVVDEPDTDTDSEADTGTDSTPDTAPAPKRTAPRTRRGLSTAARVAALRDKHPDMSAADIAARLKVSDRTVRRYLSAPTDAPQAIAA
jgi:hypothetical protein